MQKELVERLAKDAGLTMLGCPPFTTDYGCSEKEILEFAARVAEECAKEAESVIDPEWPSDDQSVQAQNIAAAIRAKFAPESEEGVRG